MVETEEAFVKGAFCYQDTPSMSKATINSTEVEIIVVFDHLIAFLSNKLLVSEIALIKLVVLRIDKSEIKDSALSRFRLLDQRGQLVLRLFMAEFERL